MNRITFLLIIFISYSLFFLFSFPLWYPFLLFLLGLLLGYFFHILDRIVQVLFIPEMEMKKREFLSTVQKGKFIRGFTYLVHEVPSASSSFYFLCLYFPLAFYLISSSGSVVGTGLMLGLGLSYCAHFILSYKKVKEVRALYFQPLSPKVKDSEVQKVMGAFITLFVLLSAFVAF